jgi:ferric-dicitrate binding protein FerR (iron transport regulator)
MDPNTYREYSWQQFVEDATFRRYVAEPTPALTEFWERVAQQYPRARPRMQQARLFLLALSEEYSREQQATYREQRAALNRTLSEAAHRDIHPVRKTGSRWLARPWVVAATALLIVSAFIGGYYFTSSGQPRTSVHATAFGEQKRLSLPDGTLVQLNAGSELRFADNWEEAGRREVWLVGEAYFTVARGPTPRQHKFLVHTDDLDVTVVGTQFNVNTAGSQGTEVILEEGKVLLSYDEGGPGPDTVQMMPGERVVYDRRTTLLLREEIRPDEQAPTSWKDGRLVFENVTLRDAGRRIEQIYGRKLRFVPEALGERSVYLTTSATDLDEFKLLLEALTNDELEVDIRPRTVTVRTR